MSDLRSGLLAIVGRPNVGKSTLLNALIGEKVSIVSRRAQTTRHRIMGILTKPDAQYVFVDTPGFQTKHGNALNRVMNRACGRHWPKSMSSCLVVEAGRFDARDRAVRRSIPERSAADHRREQDRPVAGQGAAAAVSGPSCRGRRIRGDRSGKRGAQRPARSAARRDAQASARAGLAVCRRRDYRSQRKIPRRRVHARKALSPGRRRVALCGDRRDREVRR
jgi:hypothetical protein